jgi:hypothetical protein
LEVNSTQIILTQFWRSGQIENDEINIHPCILRIRDRDVSTPLYEFDPVTSEGAVRLLMNAPAKQFHLGLLPTWLMNSLTGRSVSNTCTDVQFVVSALRHTDQQAFIIRLLQTKQSMDQRDLVFNFNFIPYTYIQVSGENT